jgi:hypothetical protein
LRIRIAVYGKGGSFALLECKFFASLIEERPEGLEAKGTYRRNPFPVVDGILISPITKLHEMGKRYQKFNLPSTSTIW